MRFVRCAPLVLLLVMAIALPGCTAKQAASPPVPSPATEAASAPATATDYSQPAHWLAVPKSPTKNADVFYVYPTAYSKQSATDPNFSAVDNARMLKGAQAAYERQAMAFDPSANIYAPYYRQIDAKYQLALSPAEQTANIDRVPLLDVTAAFEYYLQHYNQGRPFILVSHSQGSAVVKRLLSGYLKDHPDVYKRMIAAYVVGQSITPQYLAENPHLKYANGPDDTGVIISWNTEAPVVAGTNPVTEPGGIAINPITWTTDETTVTARQSLGAVQLNPLTGKPERGLNGQPKRVMGLADARVDKKRGVVICSTADPKKYEFGFPEGVYHSFDYPFYFFDVRANAAARVAKYLAENGE